MDIILRNCGRVGWLGLVMENGKETYRTGKHWADKEMALYEVDTWLEGRDE